MELPLDGLPEPLTERELKLARHSFRYALDTFNESLKLGYDREQLFQAYYDTPAEELNARITEKFAEVLKREAARANT